jgi:hypothetical protein
MPLSDDPAKRARQLANLRPGAGAWTPGSAPHLIHGGRTRAPWKSPIFGEIKSDLVSEIRRSFPHLLDEEGEVLPQFALAVDAAALQVLTLRRITGFFATKGDVDERGRLRVAELDAQQRACDRLLRWLTELAATPVSAARAGHDVARARREQHDLALQMHRRLLEREGVDVDG